jgi:hypothetical protein
MIGVPVTDEYTMLVRGVGLEPTKAFARGFLTADVLSPPPFPRGHVMTRLIRPGSGTPATFIQSAHFNYKYYFLVAKILKIFKPLHSLHINNALTGPVNKIILHFVGKRSQDSAAAPYSFFVWGELLVVGSIPAGPANYTERVPSKCARK